VSLESQHNSKKGLVRIWRAFFYTKDGLLAALIHEHAFRQEALLCLLLVPLALWLPVTMVEHILLLVTAVLILVVELLNSAIESVVDRVSVEDHELSKRAKDMGSAAVFLSFVILMVTWGGIAGPVVVKWMR
jgi:diacylglycerol kinase (ATP)